MEHLYGESIKALAFYYISKNVRVKHFDDIKVQVQLWKLGYTEGKRKKNWRMGKEAQSEAQSLMSKVNGIIRFK